MRRRLAAAALAAVALASCSSGKDNGSPNPTTPLLQQTTTSSVPDTPVVARMLSPEKDSVQGIGGRGMVVVLTFTAKDPTVLPAQFRLGGSLPAPAAAVKPGHNPAFAGLVVTLSTTGPALGGPTANLANLFQIVSPAKQSDGSMVVSAVWTNDQAGFGVDADATLVAFTVSGAAPDVVPATTADLGVNSNPTQVSFHIGATNDAAGLTSTTTVGGSSTTVSKATTTTGKATTTTTTAKPSTTVSPSTTRAATTTVPPTTSTTSLLGLLPF
jgi:hypothetical protein